MWAFLATEIMFFGGLFAAYTVYRYLYLPAFEAGSRLLDVKLGAINTAVLIGSSLTMALAVRSAQTNKRKALVLFLLLTMMLGAFFWESNSYEYSHKWEHDLVPGLQLCAGCEEVAQIQTLKPGAACRRWSFFCFYFFMTGMHALHMIIGFGIMTVIPGAIAARTVFLGVLRAD